MNSEVEEVINRFKEIRKEKGMSIIKLSVESGISRSHIFYIESKKTVPSLETLAKLTDAMGVHLKDLFV